jgi:hypothetical protein
MILRVDLVDLPSVSNDHPCLNHAPQGNAKILLQRVRDQLEQSSGTMRDHYLALNPARDHGVSVRRLKEFIRGFHCGFTDATVDVLLFNKFQVNAVLEFPD